MKVEWSADALADLDRFAAFIHEHHPDVAKIVAQEIIAKAQVLSQHPQLGRSVVGREEFRELVLQVLNAAYVFRRSPRHAVGFSRARGPVTTRCNTVALKLNLTPDIERDMDHEQARRGNPPTDSLAR